MAVFRARSEQIRDWRIKITPKLEKKRLNITNQLPILDISLEANLRMLHVLMSNRCYPTWKCLTLVANIASYDMKTPKYGVYVVCHDFINQN